MIDPSDVVSAVINRLTTYKSQIEITGVEELYEDFSPKLRPPYATVHSDFMEDAEYYSSAGVLANVPVEIKIILFSSSQKTAAAAFAQAFSAAVKALQYAVNNYEIDGHTVKLRSRLKPFDIWAKRKDQSIIMCNLYYTDQIM